MRKNRSNDILNFLKAHPENKYQLEQLAEQFGISIRQVRNYIYQINSRSQNGDIIINLSGQYGINQNQMAVSRSNNPLDLTSDERANFIISKLISSKASLSIFDFSEELCVSEATIESDLKKVRRRISSFDLSLANKNDNLSIEGQEKKKRSLASYMLSNTSYSKFFFNDRNPFLNNSGFQYDLIRKHVTEILNDCNFFYNDYSLNNILLHLIITIQRLKSGFYLDDAQILPEIGDSEAEAAEKLTKFIEKYFSVEVTINEQKNIASFLSCNLATMDYKVINKTNIGTYIDHQTVDLVEYILNRVSDYYLIDSFDDVFFVRFALHIQNLLKRLNAGFSVHNPMKEEIQHTYPLIFDVAVYAATLIEEKTAFILNSDEISLIALHIGGFIENNSSNKNKISAIYVYTNYHNFYQQNITVIRNRFERELNIVYSVSISDYHSITDKPDLIISDEKLDGAIVVSPFITDLQLEQIQSVLKRLEKQKETSRFVDSFTKLFTPDLFFTDIKGNDEFDVILRLSNKLQALDVFDNSFIEAVINREKLSSTHFISRVAIPHAISQTLSKSFISIVTYDEKQKWGSGDINLIIFFGISYAERKNFRFVFNYLVKILEKESNVNTLCSCRSYEEVITSIKDMLSSMDATIK